MTTNRLNPKLVRQLRRRLESLGYRSTSRGFVLAAKVADAENVEGREQWDEAEDAVEKDAAMLADTF